MYPPPNNLTSLTHLTPNLPLHLQKEHAPTTTLVLLLRPRQVVDICYLQGTAGEFVYSDIKLLPQGASLPAGLEYPSSIVTPSNFKNPSKPRFKSKHPHNNTVPSIGFPFLPNQQSRCSQGVGGGFTHVFPETYFAVDLDCEVGTPIVAVGDGMVVEVQTSHRHGGIHASRLFAWNSLMLELDSGLVVEYVHIKGVACVPKQVVKKGDVIAYSGCVGFCPIPHLHIQVHASKEENAPTIPFVFEGGKGGVFEVSAGGIYTSQGAV